MKRTRRWSSPRSYRLLSVALCFWLMVTMVVLPFGPVIVRADAKQSNSLYLQRFAIFTAPARLLASLLTPLQGGGLPAVPGPNLPNLAVARAVQPSEPVAPAAIPSDQACTDCTPCPTCGPGSVNHAPAAQAGGPYYGTVGTPLVVSGLGSFDVDPGDDISGYAWTFGDGTGVVTGATPVHTYAAPGSYQISLTGTDSHTTTSMASTTASITAAPPPVPTPDPTPGNAALFIAQTVPTTMTAGQSYPVSVTMRNTGTTTWSAAHLYRLGSENPLDNSVWGTSRIHLPTTAAPGADVTFNFTVIAPYSGADEPPPAQFQWRMVQEFVQWFDTSTPSQTVTIISNYQPGTPSALEHGPFSSLFASRIAVEHRTGQPREDLLSGNYNWGMGLVALAGRSGLNLNLGLSYNSLAAWTKVDPPYSRLLPEKSQQPTSWTFDADRGFPSVGFRLGFPTIQGPFNNTQTGGSSYLALMPSGGRVELRRVGSTSVYEAADSSYLQLLDGGNGSMLLRTTDGTQMAYWSINSEYRCTEVKDRNGNLLTIKYDPINGAANLGRMTSIVDTLGRTINFNYDTNYRLQSITQLRNGQTHVWATFGYDNRRIETNFGESSPGEGGEIQGIVEPGGVVLGLPEGSTVSVLTQVGLDDGSRYTFEYTSWGQVYRIKHLAADGHQLNYVSYNLPPSNSSSQSDSPRFTQRQDGAENWNNNNAVTTNFQINVNGASGEVITNQGTSDQVTYREFFATAYNDWRRGLVTRTEVHLANSSTPEKTTVTEWTQDSISVAYPLNPRATGVTISDASGNRRRTTIDYGAFGLPSDSFEWGRLGTDGWTLLRRMHIDFELSPGYLNRRIIGLAKHHHETRYCAVNRYNTAGSPLFNRDPLGHQTTLSYTNSFSSDGTNTTTPPGNTLAYPTTVTIYDPGLFSSTLRYHYDLGAITPARKI